MTKHKAPQDSNSNKGETEGAATDSKAAAPKQCNAGKRFTHADGDATLLFACGRDAGHRGDHAWTLHPRHLAGTEENTAWLVELEDRDKAARELEAARAAKLEGGLT